MQGDDRSRLCLQCNLHVYNFAQMSQDEIAEILVEKEGRICARTYQRSDGTLLTEDCPIGLRAKLRRAGRLVVSALSAVLKVCAADAQDTASQIGSGEVQTANASVTITVSDSSGAVVAGSKVSLELLSRGLAYQGKTDANGSWKAEGILPGVYKLKISAPPGFATDESEIRIASPITSIHRVLDVVVTVGVLVQVTEISPVPDLANPLVQIDPLPLMHSPVHNQR